MFDYFAFSKDNLFQNVLFHWNILSFQSWLDMEQKQMLKYEKLP